MPHTWDPDRYLTYADERGRPFVELVARIGAAAPATVVDLGCGPGNLTALLRERWPDADVLGLDSSPEMIEKARGRRPDASPSRSPTCATGRADAEPGRRPGLQRRPSSGCPATSTCCPSLVGRVRAGRLAGLPGARATSTSRATRSAASSPPRRRTPSTPRDVAVPSSHDPAVYLEALAGLGCRVDAWETTYLHVLTGPDPVFTWVSGTGARPTLQALPDDLRPAFEEEFKRRLRAAYPERDGRVVLPFRRIFVVAQVSAA